MDPYTHTPIINPTYLTYLPTHLTSPTFTLPSSLLRSMSDGGYGYIHNGQTTGVHTTGHSGGGGGGGGGGASGGSGGGGNMKKESKGGSSMSMSRSLAAGGGYVVEMDPDSIDVTDRLEHTSFPPPTLSLPHPCYPPTLYTLISHSSYPTHKPLSHIPPLASLPLLIPHPLLLSTTPIHPIHPSLPTS